jgi:hypothetical protein
MAARALRVQRVVHDTGACALCCHVGKMGRCVAVGLSYVVTIHWRFGWRAAQQQHCLLRCIPTAQSVKFTHICFWTALFVGSCFVTAHLTVPTEQYLCLLTKGSLLQQLDTQQLAGYKHVDCKDRDIALVRHAF